MILLHGLGADGNDLIGLAPYWAPLLPDAEFLSPNAPFPATWRPTATNGSARGTASPAARLAGARAAAPILDAFIDERWRSAASTKGDLALVGFSQGTMMSLFVGPRASGRLPASSAIPAG